MFFFIHAWLVIGRINGTCISRTLLFSRCKNFSIPIYTGFSHVLGFIMHRVFDILFLFHSRWFFFFSLSVYLHVNTKWEGKRGELQNIFVRTGKSCISSNRYHPQAPVSTFYLCMCWGLFLLLLFYFYWLGS